MPWDTNKACDDAVGGKGTFVTHNRKSINEYAVEGKMGNKKRVNTLYEARNGLQMTSLGDKIYKAPEYMTGYFRDGGLIAGST